MAGLKPFRRNGLVFDDGFDDFYNMIDNFFDTGMPRTLDRASFKVDISKDDDKYLIEAEMPGFDKEDIDISVNDDSITISASKVEEKDDSDDDKNYIHKERRSSSMYRTISFVDMDKERLSAKLDKGLLTVEVGRKKEDGSVKKIEID